MSYTNSFNILENKTNDKNIPSNITISQRLHKSKLQDELVKTSNKYAPDNITIRQHLNKSKFHKELLEKQYN